MKTDDPAHRPAAGAGGAGRRLRLHTVMSVLTIAVGLVLMTMMIVVESEPGTIPLLLVASGIAWYLITRARIRSHPR